MELLSPEDIKRVSVDILKYIDTSCRKNQIEYFIARHRHLYEDR